MLWPLNSRKSITAAMSGISDGWPARFTHRRSVQDARHMPAPFRADHLVRAGPEGDRIRMRLHMRHHLDIVEIGEIEFRPVMENFKAEPRIEVDHVLLHVTVKNAIAFHPGQLHAGANQLE